MLNDEIFAKAIDNVLDNNGVIRPPRPPPLPQSNENNIESYNTIPLVAPILPPPPHIPPFSIQSSINPITPILPPPPPRFPPNIQNPVQPSINPQSPSKKKTEVYQKYEISKAMTKRLEDNLNNFKIVFVFDDSSSMTTRDYNSKAVTRWDELLNFSKISLEIATLFNPEGCDIYFFNRATKRNIKDHKQLSEIFSFAPFGSTTIVDTLKKVYSDHLNNLYGKQLLILIATDGEPTNILGEVKIDEFKEFLKKRPSNVYTTIMACTDDLNSIGYLNGLDKEMVRLDVVRDYKNEFEEIRKAKGVTYRFSYGDYITKTLIGSIDKFMDELDLI